MTDIRERLSETIRKALMGDGTVNYCLAPNLCEGGPCPCCMNAVHDVLTQLPLTPEQLEGLASGDMVVRPKEANENMCNAANDAFLADPEEAKDIWRVMSAAQEEQP